jgi:predicted hydrocarbon binding protein
MLYITVNEQSGLLVKIYRCLHKSDYKITSHHLTPHPTSGKVVVKIIIAEGELPINFSLESQLLNIEGCLDIGYDEPQWNDDEELTSVTNTISETKAKEIKVAAQYIVNDLDNIENLVASFRRKCGDNNVSQNLYHLGFEVGSAVYETEYSLGKPLKLELAIKRMLSDATKKFGKSSCGTQTFTIEDNIFCNVRNPDGDCDFTKGYITGFLHSSPTTDEVKVQRNSCRSHGQFSCSFEFQ